MTVRARNLSGIKAEDLHTRLSIRLRRFIEIWGRFPVMCGLQSSSNGER